ncbi:hypothetical protein AB0C02_27870 [Micromonospora sp. NPDC048999]|uniref:hypothetical protein n=1 Tax=Micromonospora sp. NPDC048999 TaxID=3155391 RepID=UPI0034073DB5
MTHPSPHPGTPTPPAGPSRALSTWLDRIRAARSRSAKAATVAGSRSRSAEPMSAVDRVRKYRAQTGRPGLTPAQSRRAMKKLNRAVG